VSESSSRVVRTVPAPFLLERIFFDHKTGEKIHSDTLYFVVEGKRIAERKLSEKRNSNEKKVLNI